MWSSSVKRYAFMGSKGNSSRAGRVGGTPGTSRLVVIRSTSAFITPAHGEANDPGTIFKWPEHPHLTVVKL